MVELIVQVWALIALCTIVWGGTVVCVWVWNFFNENSKVFHFLKCTQGKPECVDENFPLRDIFVILISLSVQRSNRDCNQKLHEWSPTVVWRFDDINQMTLLVNETQTLRLNITSRDEFCFFETQELIRSVLHSIDTRLKRKVASNTKLEVGQLAIISLRQLTTSFYQRAQPLLTFGRCLRPHVSREMAGSCMNRILNGLTLKCSSACETSISMELNVVVIESLFCARISVI